MPNWFWLISVAIYGGCIGSFLNVVIYRLPEGKSLVSPGSRCPSCGHELAWYDNVPVLAWLWLRGKCRSCKAPISIQYPIVEALTALMFMGLFWAYYMQPFGVSPLRPQFFHQGLSQTWPVLIVHLVLLAGLFAATVIDAKLFIIPRSIPWTLTLVAAIILPLAVWYGSTPLVIGLIPISPPKGTCGAAGGLIGVGLSLILLKLMILPLSFADYEKLYEAHAAEQGANAKSGEDSKPEDWFHYPHARREVIKEMAFLALPIAGMMIGIWLGPSGAVNWPWWLLVLGGVGFGYLVGAGLVWMTRILGSLAFGKEAMGLGDVHLLAAIGAVLGPAETVPVFFIAPFFGLAAAMLMFGLSAVLKKRFQPIPYGPYLAGAAVVVMVWRQPIMGFLRPLMENFDTLFLVYLKGLG